MAFEKFRVQFKLMYKIKFKFEEFKFRTNEFFSPFCKCPYIKPVLSIW